jgi:hypothetical protein
VKFTSQVVASASGSVGGCTYSRNRYGRYIRLRSVPVNPASAAQVIVRGALATLVARWTSTLTAAERDGWTTWAINTPQTDALGQPIILTGQNAYIMMNTVRIQSGLSVVDVAPVIYAGAVLTPPDVTVATASTETIGFTFDNTDEWANAVGGALLVFIARPQNVSKLFFAGPYRLAGSVLGAAAPPASPQSIVSDFPFAAGQRIFVRFRAVNADGRISTPWRADQISV